VIVFHQEILETEISDTTAGSVLVSQHYWDPADPTYINENDEEVDKYITSEFLQSKVYGCQVGPLAISRNLIINTYHIDSIDKHNQEPREGGCLVADS